MCCPVCGKVHIKDPSLLIGNGSLCGDRGFLYRNISQGPYALCPIADDMKIHVLKRRRYIKDTFLFPSIWQQILTNCTHI